MADKEVKKELKKLLKHRAAIQLNVGNAVKKIDAAIKDGSVTEVMLQGALEKLQGYKDSYKADSELVWDFLIEDPDEQKVDTDMVTAEGYMEEITDHMVKYRAKLEKMNQPSKVPDTANVNTSQTSVVSDGYQRSSKPKLPELEITSFDGDPKQWRTFWDSFKSTIHDNDSISEIDKFKYLQCYLSGDVLTLTQGYELTAANYVAVVEVLQDRYGDPEAAIFAHIMALLDLPEATNDINRLQVTYDACESHIRGLARLGVPESTFGLMFTPMILSKLPPSVKTELHRKQGDQPWTLESLRKSLGEEIKARRKGRSQYEASMGCNGSHSTHKGVATGYHHEKGKGKKEHATASQLASTAKKKLLCAFCGGDHFHEECKKCTTARKRREIAAANSRCFSCLGLNHRYVNCPRKRTCKHCRQSGHHRSLCHTQFPDFKGKRDTVQTAHCSTLNPIADEYVPMSANQTVAHNQDVFLQTAIATVVNKDTGVRGRYRLLFDDAGSRTFITCDKARELGLKIIGEDVVAVAGFEDKVRRTRRYKVVKFSVEDLEGNEVPIVANVTEHITADIERQPIDVSKYPFVRGLQLADPQCNGQTRLPVDILLAGDYYYDFVVDGILRCDGGMVFVPSRLGYLTAGVSESSRSKTVSNMLITMGRATGPDYDLERFWKLEEIGVKEQVDTKEDDLALQKFRETVQFKEDRYMVTLPWATDEVELPDNFGLAKARLVSLLKKLKGSPKILETYDQTFKDQLAKQIIEDAPEVPTGSLVHYIPHHCVITPTKATTKVRVVYDASAKASAKLNSLNDCLLRGPLFLSDICGLIVRFRMSKIGVVADIEKAFLQVELQEKERDVTRFLWIKDLGKPPTSDNLKILRFRRVFFGAKSSPFLLEATVRHHLLQWNTPNALAIADNVYVDNVVIGKSNVEEALEFYVESKEMFGVASMNLREWYTNSPQLRVQLAESDRGKGNLTKVLGLVWDTAGDTLSCVVGKRTEAPITKRKVLHELASVYDPCGWCSPVTVSGKILMQDIWAAKHGWDEALPDELQERWQTIARSLEQLPKFTLPRQCLDMERLKGVQLHVFGDASKRAYAACGYLRVETVDGTQVALLFVRNRVSPLKQLTIPKLELMAAVIGVRLLDYLRQELRLSEVPLFLWSDSQCVLHWLNQGSLSTVFVDNRIREIKSHADVHFRYVPTKDNPADVVTKGCTIEELHENELWLHGPTWLRKPSPEWPEDVVPVSIQCEEEQQPVVQLVQVSENDGNRQIVVIERFSRLVRLVRAVAWVIRFIQCIRAQTIADKDTLTVPEVQQAMVVLLKQVQRSRYADIMDGSPATQSKLLVKQMDLYMDAEGLLRCRSRFAHADLPETAKSPILLPRDNHFTTLVIRDRHQELAHAGVPHTLSSLRQEFWIVHGRSQVKLVIGRCVICRKAGGGPYVLPRAPNLPPFRVTTAEPFACVGIDYLGPLYIRALGKESKAWICIYVCAAVRAVHLEVITSLSAEQFLLCLRRFIALYGLPRVIVSDNAKQFHTAQRALVDIWYEVISSPIVQDYVSTRGVMWKFIVQKAPWMGGMYERLVKSTKDALKKTLSRRKLSLTELQTVAYEIAAILNTRPLVYVEDEAGQTTLTPGHFLLSGRARRLPIAKEEEGDEYIEKRTTKDDLILEWKRIQAIIDGFWKCWRNQYLPTLLQERGREAAQRATACFRPQVGNVVLIKDDAYTRRLEWKLGKVVELVAGSDGQVRSAKVRTPKGKILHRPLKVLFPLEEGQSDPVMPLPASASTPVVGPRPTRRAAKVAAEKIRYQLDTSDDE